MINWTEEHQEVTEGYPDPISSRTSDDLPPRTRGFIVNDVDHCTACGECVSLCPAGSIFLDSEVGEHGKVWVSVFDVDTSSCSLCGLCVEVCEPGSLRHSKAFEGATRSLDQMIRSFGHGRLSEAQRSKWVGRRFSRERES
jgi:formate hydrogenlyase subunit 6/NADH:ubiquinone oxidoreductase subunit I